MLVAVGDGLHRGPDQRGRCREEEVKRGAEQLVPVTPGRHCHLSQPFSDHLRHIPIRMSLSSSEASSSHSLVTLLHTDMQ